MSDNIICCKRAMKKGDSKLDEKTKGVFQSGLYGSLFSPITCNTKKCHSTSDFKCVSICSKSVFC